MNWQNFIKLLLKDFRTSTYRLGKEHGISSATLSGIMTGKTISPNQNTVRDLEIALNIKIDDSDPENITYSKNIPESGPAGHKPNLVLVDYKVQEFPVVGTVSAGPTELADAEIHGEKAIAPYFSPGHRCFAVKVDGNSMDSTIPDGSIALVDMDMPLHDNCIAAVKLKNGKQFIKRYKDLNYQFIGLYSDNKEYETIIIDKDHLVSAYRVVWTGQKHY